MVNSARLPRFMRPLATMLAVVLGAQISAVPAYAQAQFGEPTYAELVELAQAANIVLRVEIDDQVIVPVERAPGLAPGHVRLYLESVTQALLAGNGPIGESQAFLADVLPDERGRAPDLEENLYLLFAQTVDGRPGVIGLVGGNAMQLATAGLEQRIRTVLTQLANSGSPPVLTGIREVISVPGNLAGESETQIFLETMSGDPVSLTVIRRPGRAPQWGVSLTEIVDQAARAPAPETLDWYLLACHLPKSLPEKAFLQSDFESQDRARSDYAVVLSQLGECERSI